MRTPRGEPVPQPLSHRPEMSYETHASVGRMKIFNLNSDEWDATRDREGWRCSGTGVGERIGGELLGATMSEIEPGSRLWPYHTHYLNEEWVIVLRGEPTLRTPEGEHVLKDGDVVCSRGARPVGIRSSTEQTHRFAYSCSPR